MTNVKSQIVGLDEVGRGCWAGPLVAAAVILHFPMSGLRDSKVLSKKKRELLKASIYDNAEVGIGWVSAAEIDEIGLTAATQKAMKAALAAIVGQFDQIIIDGNYNYLPGVAKARTLPKADSLIPAVSAASIVAKVARDNYMKNMALKFPKYGFDKHVGYGTKLHAELLKRHGVCKLHRLSYKPVRAVMA